VPAAGVEDVPAPLSPPSPAMPIPAIAASVVSASSTGNAESFAPPTATVVVSSTGNPSAPPSEPVRDSDVLPTDEQRNVPTVERQEAALPPLGPPPVPPTSLTPPTSLPPAASDLGSATAGPTSREPKTGAGKASVAAESGGE